MTFSNVGISRAQGDSLENVPSSISILGRFLNCPPKANGLSDLVEKVTAGERLNVEDAVRLMKSSDILLLGRLADAVRHSKVGEEVYFSTNININPTNACVLRCQFCAFYRPLDHPEAYTERLDDILDRVQHAHNHGVREVHIVGGLNPRIPFSYFLELIRRVKTLDPDIHVKAFTAVEIDFFVRVYKMSIEKVLQELVEAGLDTLPGGGAEIFSPRVRELVCKGKISGERWLEVIEIAHRLGISSTATMLYGHVETIEERVDHLQKLRDLQDKTGKFTCFVPLPFHPENTPLAHLGYTCGVDDVKVYAVSRLFLDNFMHLKGLWNYLDEKFAQVILHFGVDDLGGTFVEERIAHAAGAKTPQALSQEKMVRIIQQAKRIPVETDSSYKVRKRWE